MYLPGVLTQQEKAATDKYQVSPRKRMVQHREQRLGEPYDPRKREQERHPREHGEAQADCARPCLLSAVELAGEDRDEADIVYAQDNLQYRQGKEATTLSADSIVSISRSFLDVQPARSAVSLL